MSNDSQLDMQHKLDDLERQHYVKQLQIDDLELRIQRLRDIIITGDAGCYNNNCTRIIDMCPICDEIRLIRGCDACANAFDGCELPFSEEKCETCQH